MLVRKRFRFAGFQFLLVVFLRRSASALRLRSWSTWRGSGCCLSRPLPDYCCPTARARFSELVVRRRQPRVVRALLGGRERLWALPNYVQNCCVRCRWCCPEGGVCGAASAAHALPSPRAPVPREPPGRAALSFCCPHKVRAPATARSGLAPFVGVLAGRQPVTTERWRGRRGVLKKVTLAPGCSCAPAAPQKRTGAAPRASTGHAGRPSTVAKASHRRNRAAVK